MTKFKFSSSITHTLKHLTNIKIQRTTNERSRWAKSVTALSPYSVLILSEITPARNVIGCGLQHRSDVKILVENWVDI